MWVPILLISSLPVSDAVWAGKYGKGVVGRAITINCPYRAEYRSNTKYWCHGWTRQCRVLVETNGQHARSGRVSITDNPERGIFTVTMEELQSGDTGWYKCEIATPGDDPMLDIHVQVSDEPVSAPVLRYLSPTNGSRLGGSLTLSCESARGSLPIRYTWHEKNKYGDPTISNSNQLDLSCEILRGQHRGYYCTASSNRATKSSEILTVKVFNGAGTCSYVTEINNTVSGALWAESEVRGVVGRAITIDCHYAAVYRSHTKYWYRGRSRQSAHVVETNGKHEQGGRVSITDNPARGIFTVAVEDLHSGDTGWYSCGITASCEPTFEVHLQVSEASNKRGSNSSEMVNVSISSNGVSCSFHVKINGTGKCIVNDGLRHSALISRGITMQLMGSCNKTSLSQNLHRMDCGALAALSPASDLEYLNRVLHKSLQET
ncbi:polymeric immunoglobulin receptor-like [Rhinoraja longicauda]